MANTIALPTASARALWTCEISGQLSDGAWENASPMGHWQFWNHLEVIEGAPKVTSTERCKKNGYVLTSLLEYVGDRMLLIGRMAKCTEVGVTRGAAEYMPASFTEWQECKLTGKWQYDFVAKYMEPITEDVARKFYNTTYTEKELRADLKLIKSAMKTAVVSRY